MKVLASCLLIMLLASGCHRAVYTNFQGADNRHAYTSEQLELLIDDSESSWQHFFIFGWIPSEMAFNAAAKCGGAEHIASINTRQTFTEGLVASLAGFYVNVYSPYDALVVCDNKKTASN